MQAELFNRIRAGISGDWWCCRVDANKFFLDDPSEIIANIEPWANCLVGSAFDFKFTRADYERYVAGLGKFMSKSCRTELRYFCNEWA